MPDSRPHASRLCHTPPSSHNMSKLVRPHLSPVHMRPVPPLRHDHPTRHHSRLRLHLLRVPSSMRTGRPSSASMPLRRVHNPAPYSRLAALIPPSHWLHAPRRFRASRRLAASYIPAPEKTTSMATHAVRYRPRPRCIVRLSCVVRPSGHVSCRPCITSPPSGISILCSFVQTTLHLAHVSSVSH